MQLVRSQACGYTLPSFLRFLHICIRRAEEEGAGQAVAPAYGSIVRRPETCRGGGGRDCCNVGELVVATVLVVLNFGIYAPWHVKYTNRRKSSRGTTRLSLECRAE